MKYFLNITNTLISEKYCEQGKVRYAFNVGYLNSRPTDGMRKIEFVVHATHFKQRPF